MGPKRRAHGKRVVSTSKKVLDRSRQLKSDNDLIEPRKVMVYLNYAAGMKQGELAVIYGVSRQTINEWCNEAEPLCADFVMKGAIEHYKARTNALMERAFAVYDAILDPANQFLWVKSLSTVHQAAKDILVSEGVIVPKVELRDPSEGGDDSRETGELIEELDGLVAELRATAGAGNKARARKKKA